MLTPDDHSPPQELVHKLRDANQNLVIAALRAQDLQDQAEAFVERQKEFLSMLAHELRNPLAPIVMAVEMLQKLSVTDSRLLDIRDIITRQVGHMTRLLDDLLDTSRVIKGKINLEKSRLQLSDVVRNAAEMSQPFFDKQFQTLLLEIPEKPIYVDGDAVRLTQVFSNLLINASKYGPSHEPITLSAHLGEGATVSIAVKDKGVGIEPALQPFIFDLFTQAPRTLDRSQGGLGIGLAMVRALVEMHGGTVVVRSEGTGRGSEFIVELPVSADLPVVEVHPSVDAPAPASLAHSRHCRVLIIEDNIDTNETLNYCLAADGHTLASAFTGPTGLAMQQEGHYDVVVCDIGLPGMDGFEVVRKIRQLGVVPPPCCIAMTGYGDESFRARAVEAGFDHYLIKPILLNTLQDVISDKFPAPALV